MKCKKCGASLLDTDKFCNQCGWKVVRKRKCPECGAALREGVKFCPECGSMVDGETEREKKIPVREEETTDIPIDDIEQNILSETEREMRSGKKNSPSHEQHRSKKPTQVSEYEEERMRKSPQALEYEAEKRRKARQTSEYEGERRRKPVPAPEPMRKKRPESVKERYYEEWEDDDDDDDDDDHSVMAIVSVVMIFLIIAVAAVLIFTMVKKQSEGEEEEQLMTEQEEGEEEEDSFELEDGDGSEYIEEQEEEGGEAVDVTVDAQQPAGSLTIVSNVNVRDNPSTQGTNVIKVAKAGEVYEYISIEPSGDWYDIILEDGSVGYVFKDYVQVN